MKIALYREIVSLLRKARALKPESAWIPIYAAKEISGFAYEAGILDAGEYIRVMEHFQRPKRRPCRYASKNA